MRLWMLLFAGLIVAAACGGSVSSATAAICARAETAIDRHLNFPSEAEYQGCGQRIVYIDASGWAGVRGEVSTANAFGVRSVQRFLVVLPPPGVIKAPTVELREQAPEREEQSKALAEAVRQLDEEILMAVVQCHAESSAEP